MQGIYDKAFLKEDYTGTVLFVWFVITTWFQNIPFLILIQLYVTQVFIGYYLSRGNCTTNHSVLSPAQPQMTHYHSVLSPAQPQMTHYNRINHNVVSSAQPLHNYQNKSQCRVTSTTSVDTFTRINHNVLSPSQLQPTHLPGLGMKKYIHNKIKQVNSKAVPKKKKKILQENNNSK